MKYSYRAVNTNGGYVNGTLEADSSRAAARALMHQGLNVIEVRDLTATAHRRKSSRKRLKKQDILIFMHQLCTLLESGVSLEETVDSLAESAGHPFLAQEFESIGAAIRRGEQFSQALGASKLKLPAYFYPLTEAGELTGKLAQALRDGVKQWEYDLETSNELKSALTYPIILIVSGIGAVILIFTMVVPKFANILDKSKGDIPFLAQVVLGAGRLMNENLLLVGMAGATLAAFGGYGFFDQGVRRRVRDALARLPLFKDWLMESDIGRWSAMMATLLENRVALLKSLELAQRHVTLSLLYARLSHVSRAVRGGMTLADALRESHAITLTGYNLVRVGERSGELPAMLRSLANLYTESMRTRIKRFLVLVEPAAIIIIGSVVGLIMGGIILAIVSVNNVAI